MTVLYIFLPMIFVCLFRIMSATMDIVELLRKILQALKDSAK